MVKIMILALLAAVAFVQIVKALDADVAYSNDIRYQLSLYNKFREETDSVPYADELKKLIEFTEKALATETVEEKKHITSSLFNIWISNKLEEAQVNADILDTIEYCKTLVTADMVLETEIKTTISNLENLLKETDLKQKREKLLDLENSLSAEFQKFLKEKSLPDVNRQLQKTAEFFATLLKDKDINFAKEIEALKVKVEAALEDNVSIDDRKKVLQTVTFTDNEQLNEFLQQKNLEFS